MVPPEALSRSPAARPEDGAVQHVETCRRQSEEGRAARASQAGARTSVMAATIERNKPWR
jgi:hypothetical protein